MTWDKYYKKDKLNVKPQALDIALFYHRTWNPWENIIIGCIRRVSDGLFNHAGIFVADGSLMEANPGGIEKTDFKKKYVNNDEGVLILRFLNLTDVQRAIGLAFLDGAEGGDYSYGDIWNFIFHTGGDSKHRFCSELAAETYDNMKIKISHKPLVDTAPHDIFDYQYTTPEGVYGSAPLWQIVGTQNLNMDAILDFQKKKWSK